MPAGLTGLKIALAAVVLVAVMLVQDGGTRGMSILQTSRRE